MNVNRIINILRHVTVTVKIMPFVFVATQLITMICFMFIDDTETTWLDLMFYVSPLVILFEITLSYILELCKWHRLQCSLPLLPLSSVIYDEYVSQLTNSAADLNFAFVIVLFLASLFNGYKLFCKH